MSILASVTSHRELVENLVVRDVKARYKQSFLGYAWAIAHPLITALIFALVGGVLMRQTVKGLPYAVHCYFGLLVWNLFATGLMTATEGLVSHIGLITKIYFPREVFPISAVLSKLVDFGFGLIGIAPLLLYFGVAPGITVLWLLPLTAILLLFTMGLGMLCACANLFFRDVRYLVQLTLSLLMYLVPNLYPLERVSEAHHKLYILYMLNPVAVIIEASRRAAFPQAGDMRPLLPFLAAAAVTSVVTFAVGYVVFKRHEPRFAESI